MKNKISCRYLDVMKKKSKEKNGSKISMVYVQDWLDMHCGAIYCSLGLPTPSLSRICRFAVSRPRVQ